MINVKPKTDIQSYLTKAILPTAECPTTPKTPLLEAPDDQKHIKCFKTLLQSIQ